jgi:WD40 repeat protein
LKTYIFPLPLTKVTTNTVETRLITGCKSGKIYIIDLYESSISLDPTTIPFYHGHKGPVEGLELSMDESRLVSSSNDGKCIVWDTISRQQLLAFEHNFGMNVGLELKLFPIIGDEIVAFKRYPEPLKSSFVTLESYKHKEFIKDESEQLRNEMRVLVYANNQLYATVVDSLEE